MIWQLLATIEITNNWTLTIPVTGDLFRITHNSQSNKKADLRAIFTQVFDEDNVATYFDIRRLAYKIEKEAFLFKRPSGLLNRKLGIRRLDNLADNWTITIEVLDGMPESISLPIALNEVDGLEAALADKARAENLNIHVTNTNNPHNVTAALVGAEVLGSVNTAISQHEQAADPHSQYATDTQILTLQTALDGKELAGAAAAAQTFAINRSNHTGTQALTTVNGLQTALDGKEAVGVVATAIANLTVTQIPLILPTAMVIDYEGTIAANGILSVNGLIWLLLDGATIGNTGSGASRYADAKAQTLYERLWTNPNLAIFTASGTTTTKGISAVADFGNLKRLALPDPRGRVIIPAGQGAGLTAKSRGQIGGVETHTLSISEMPSHNHLRINTTQGDFWGINPTNSTAKTTASDTGNLPLSGTQLSDTGGGQAHNNMQPFYVTAGKLILAGKS